MKRHRPRTERRQSETERRKAEEKAQKDSRSSVDSEFAKDIEKVSKSAVTFQAQARKSRHLCREIYRHKESNEENILRILLDGLVATLAEKTTRKIEAANPTISWQLSVSVSFIRTHFIVGDLILDGDTVEAAVLLRKQLESVTRLLELDEKAPERLFGKVPNIGNTFKEPQVKDGVGRMYGWLSVIAHSGKPQVGELLSVIEKEDRIGSLASSDFL